MVSNPGMRWFGSQAKVLFALFLTLFGLSALIVVASQIEQHIFRYRAERLLAEIQALELRRTPWPEALGQFRHWGACGEI